MVRRRHPRLHTVLLVCEGKTEKAFLQHLKSLYITRGSGVAVKIISAGGKGPEYIVAHAIRRSHRIASDRIRVLMDTDIPITAAVRSKAAQHDIQLIESNPCLEGLLLKILDRPVPSTSKQCKKICKECLIGPLTEKEGYGKLPFELLEKRRRDVPELAKLLDTFIF